MSRVLVDQNLTEYLRDLLPGHDVKHASELGWDRLANGALLAAAEQAGFDVLLTADKSLKFQNRLTGLKIAIVELSTNRWPTLRAHPERIQQALEGLTRGEYREVALPRPRLRRRPPPAPGNG